MESFCKSCDKYKPNLDTCSDNKCMFKKTFSNNFTASSDIEKYSKTIINKDKEIKRLTNKIINKNMFISELNKKILRSEVEIKNDLDREYDIKAKQHEKKYIKGVEDAKERYKIKIESFLSDPSLFEFDAPAFNELREYASNEISRLKTVIKNLNINSIP